MDVNWFFRGGDFRFFSLIGLTVFGSFGLCFGSMLIWAQLNLNPDYMFLCPLLSVLFLLILMGLLLILMGQTLKQRCV